MPTYEYVCTECGHQLEVVQSFKDDALTECPSCSGRLRKVFGNVGVSFKGSGFYKTDSRGSKSSSSTSGSETKTSETTAAKPAESTPAETKSSETKTSETKSSDSSTPSKAS